MWSVRSILILSGEAINGDFTVRRVNGSDQLVFDLIMVFHHFVFVGGAFSRRMFKNPKLRCIEASFWGLLWKLLLNRFHTVRQLIYQLS